LLITGFRINPDPSYQRIAQQTAEQALAMGCSPALIAQANGGSAGGSTSSGAAGGTGYRSCEWTGGARTWGQDEQIDEYYCHCFLVNSDGSFGQSVEPQGDWECGPYPH